MFQQILARHILLCGKSPIISRIPVHSIVSSSGSSVHLSSQPSLPSRYPGFRPVFVFPHIKVLKVACRLKIYQTGLTVLTIPVFLNLLSQDIIRPNTLAIAVGCSCTAVALLGLVGEVFRRFIGIIYLSDDGNKVIISHLTFLGLRKDLHLDLTDIIPISETPETMSEIVWKVKLYNGRSFLISTISGGVVDKSGFKQIIGEQFDS